MLPELCTFHKWDSVSSSLGLHRMLVHLCKLSESLICKQTQLGGSSLKKLKLATYFAIPVGRINRYFSQGDIWDCRRSEYTIPIYALWHKDYFELKATEQKQAQYELFAVSYLVKNGITNSSVKVSPSQRQPLIVHTRKGMTTSSNIGDRLAPWVYTTKPY